MIIKEHPNGSRSTLLDNRNIMSGIRPMSKMDDDSVEMIQVLRGIIQAEL